MMAILNWTSDLDTGIAEIDNQHRRIVDYINRLNELRHTHDRAGLSDVIGEMVDYTMSHFALSRWLFNHIRNEDRGYVDSAKALPAHDGWRPAVGARATHGRGAA